ncbi:MAG: hypothetical protein J1E97_04240 [Muribaculaceae bacterium]|nr:hypothetical protein [Muribaculaceae bacterium]
MKKSFFNIAGLIAILLIAAATGGCNGGGFKFQKPEEEAQEEQAPDRDPLPGELIDEHLTEQAANQDVKEQVKKEMTDIITGFRGRFTNDYYAGYFLTDLNSDGLPELWVKIGNNLSNSKFQLYFPLPTGHLRKSEISSTPGQYYLGKDYLIQVESVAPGIIDINKINIKGGFINLHLTHQLDTHVDPDAKIPDFKEKEVRFTSFRNLTILNSAFE